MKIFKDLICNYLCVLKFESRNKFTFCIQVTLLADFQQLSCLPALFNVALNWSEKGRWKKSSMSVKHFSFFISHFSTFLLWKWWKVKFACFPHCFSLNHILVKKINNYIVKKRKPTKQTPSTQQLLMHGNLTLLEYVSVNCSSTVVFSALPKEEKQFRTKCGYFRTKIWILGSSVCQVAALYVLQACVIN